MCSICKVLRKYHETIKVEIRHIHIIHLSRLWWVDLTGFRRKIGISCKSVEASKYTVKCSCKIQWLIRNYEDNVTPLLYRKQDEKGSVVSLISLVYAFLASFFFCSDKSRRHNQLYTITTIIMILWTWFASF